MSAPAFALTWTDPEDGSPGTIMKILGSNDENGAPGYAEGQVVRVAVAGPHDPAYDIENPLSTCDEDVIVGPDGSWSCDLLLWADPALAVGSYTYTATAYDPVTGEALFSEVGAFTDGAVESASTRTYSDSARTSEATSFSLGDTVYSRTTVDVKGGGQTNYRVQWYSSQTTFDASTLIQDTPYTQTAGGTYTHDESYTPLTTGSYTILLCKTSNPGPCSAGNQVGLHYFTVTAACTAPSITTHPASATKTVGESVTFSVVASGTAPLSYQWQKFVDGTWTNIGTDSSSYTISSVVTADAGDYRVIVSNDCGSATSNTATLTVNKINQTITVTTPAPANATYGESFTVTATASSGLPVAITTSGACTGSGSGSATITMTSGTGTCTVYYNQAGNDTYNPAPQVTNTVNAQKKTATVTADNKSKTYGEDNPTLTATVVGEVAGGDPITYTLSTTATTCSAVGTYPIVVTLGSNPNYDVTAYNGTLTINQKAATVTADNKSKTYGEDNPTLTATVTGEVCSVAINYSLSTTAGKYSNVGTYPIVVTLGSNPNYNVTATNGTLTITAAAATATYTSFGWYSTLSPTDKNFRVLLSATVTATGGDIRTATVTFKEGSNTLCTASVGLIDPTNLLVGSASCYWNGALSSLTSPATYDVTVVVGGNYTGTDSATVTISPASITNFITGGGYLVLNNSAGAMPGAPGSKLNFGFTVKYNKSGTNPQGKVTAILRTATGNYQIKSTAIDSLSVTPINLKAKTTGTGVFTAKAVITDLSTGLSVPGQYTMKLYVQDNGEPGGPKWAEDKLYLVVFNSAGGIWFSSNWNGTTTVLQDIMNGNLQVH